MQSPPEINRRSWHIDDIDFAAVDIPAVRNDEFLFLTLASASFVEILAEKYGGNLIAHFAGDAEVTEWLHNAWKVEEVQHGQALKAYVQAVWPEFDWEAAYAGFREEYGALCTIEQLEPQPALELVARCVVETGTATFYRAMQDYVREPVLRGLLDRIKSDEVAHYAHFRRYFERCNATERHGVLPVVATIWRRVREVRGEDAYIAFRHVQTARHPGRAFQPEEWQRYNQTVKRLARRHYSYSMVVKMLIKPIPMPEPLKRLLQWPLTGLVRLASR